MDKKNLFKICVLVVIGMFMAIMLSLNGVAVTYNTYDITMGDDEWIGLGAAAGRIVFDDQATDRIYIKDAWVGIGTNSPDASLDIEQEGTVKSNLEILHLTNTANAADMDGTETSIAFFQTYYDELAPHIGVAAWITVGTETDWTQATETQDSYMAFSTLEDVNLNERMRITSNGNVGIGTTSPQGALNIDNTDESKGLGVSFDTYHVQTTDASATTIATINTENDKAYGLTVTVVGIKNDGSWTAHYVRHAAYENDGGTLSAVGAVSSAHTAEDRGAWDVSFSLSGTDILVKVTGEAATIEWQATVEKHIIGV